jgi:hypothetical protein
MTRFGLTLLLLATLACTGETPLPPPAPSPAPAPAAPAPVSVPLYEPSRTYSPDELRQMTLRELSLRRNTIYARVGNPFVKPWLRPYFSSQPWYHPAAEADLGRLSEVDRENAARIGRTEASFTADELQARLDPLLKARDAGTAGPDDLLEIRLLSESLGADHGGAEVSSAGVPDLLTHPKLLDQRIEPAQLAEMSRRDLRILRNTVFARQGREFKSDQLQGYFEQKRWYHPDPRYSDAMLTAIDKDNIATITAEENRRGGNLGDDPQGPPFAGA